MTTSKELAQRREELAAQSRMQRAQLRESLQQVRDAVHRLWSPVRSIGGPLAIGVGALFLLRMRRRRDALPRSAAAPVLEVRRSLFSRLRTVLEVLGAARGLWAQAQRWVGH